MVSFGCFEWIRCFASDFRRETWHVAFRCSAISRCFSKFCNPGAVRCPTLETSAVRCQASTVGGRLSANGFGRLEPAVQNSRGLLCWASNLVCTRMARWCVKCTVRHPGAYAIGLAKCETGRLLGLTLFDVAHQTGGIAANSSSLWEKVAEGRMRVRSIFSRVEMPNRLAWPSPGRKASGLSRGERRLIVTKCATSKLTLPGSPIWFFGLPWLALWWPRRLLPWR